MKALRFIFGLLSWATIWLLCAKKSWKTLRGELSWKTSEQKAKIIWNELMEVWIEIAALLKDLPESKQVKELTKLWKDKLTDTIKMAKESDTLKEYLPKMQTALKEIEAWLKKQWAKLKKQWVKWWNHIKKKVNKTVDKLKKKVS